MSWNMSDYYNTDDDGNFGSMKEYERAKDNGDIDEDGYDYNGNHYNDRGDIDNR